MTTTSSVDPPSFSFLFVVILTVLLFSSTPSDAAIKNFNFTIEMKKITRLCSTKSIVTVNGMFPGPTITVTEGDQVNIKVTNNVRNNITIHCHGVRQLQTAWADGPAYITQCPIQTNQSYVYNFTVTEQKGTLFWHAHISWLRATVYGPIVIIPKDKYPFPKPDGESTIILGEWWKADTEAVISEALRTGGRPNASDAYTINGLPGPFPDNCTANETYSLKVSPGKTYLLRLINAALNSVLFFGIDNHTLTVVEADAEYVKPFSTAFVILSPGQTTNVLLHTTRVQNNYSMATGPYVTEAAIFDNTTAFGVLEYTQSNSSEYTQLPHHVPKLPKPNDNTSAANFTQQLRSLVDGLVPQGVDKRYYLTIGLGTSSCTDSACSSPKLAASINNISMVLPPISILEAYYTNKSNGLYTSDFPIKPQHPFNYTGEDALNNTLVEQGTKVVVLNYNTTVEVVMQGTNVIAPQQHPVHLHGFNFHVVGRGLGNYSPSEDPKKFNLIDPVFRNTAAVPANGWLALRFKADNPGVWFMHCHLESHTSWGMTMAWVVKDGSEADQKLFTPPYDLPKC